MDFLFRLLFGRVFCCLFLVCRIGVVLTWGVGFYLLWWLCITFAVEFIYVGNGLVFVYCLGGLHLILICCGF